MKLANYLSFILLCGVSLAHAVDRPNILLICVDDLRPELNSFGATYIHSPNIDALAASGRAFTRHYVAAPSCGPSRYSMLTGLYPLHVRGNEHIFDRARRMAKDPASVPPSMPDWFKQRGYSTVSVGKVSHHPGGRGGKAWNDDQIPELPGAWDLHLQPSDEWEHPRGIMHGYANGKQRIKKSGGDLVYEAVEGPDSIYPDGRITEEGLMQLERLAGEDKPFFLAIGLIKPHLPFGAPKRYLDLYEGVELPPIPYPEKPAADEQRTWHHSGEFMGYERQGKDPNVDAAYATEVRRHYAACVSYVDQHVGEIIAKLKATGADQNTIVVLWGDHGWHLGEHGIWGKHCLYEEALHAPLIITYPGIEKAGQQTRSIVSTVDLFPTLCDLANIEQPDFVPGRSLKAQLENPTQPGHPAISHYGSSVSVRTDSHRLTVHEKRANELYDHSSTAKETKNLVNTEPKLVEELMKLIKQ
ncbi:MAG: sulfatase [Opitutaceae bacterium]